jgi:hypothetical protein
MLEVFASQIKTVIRRFGEGKHSVDVRWGDFAF